MEKQEELNTHRQELVENCHRLHKTCAYASTFSLVQCKSIQIGILAFCDVSNNVLELKNKQIYRNVRSPVYTLTFISDMYMPNIGAGTVLVVANLLKWAATKYSINCPISLLHIVSFAVLLHSLHERLRFLFCIIKTIKICSWD